MRIIPDKTTIVLVPIEGIGGLFWKHEDTIEITDAEWAIIERGWHREVYELGTYEFPFAQYIKDLIKLRGE